MPEFQVDITRTITDRYIVTAKDWEEAEEIAALGNLDPDYTKHGEEIIDTQEVG